MRKSQVHVGGRYVAKVANQVTTVRITAELERGGWSAVNEATKRQVTIKTAARLRGPAETPVTNGDGQRMVTGNQRVLIEKLLTEKVINDDLVTRYRTAMLENRVTLEAASMFIKTLIAAPRRGNGDTQSPAPTTAKTMDTLLDSPITKGTMAVIVPVVVTELQGDIRSVTEFSLVIEVLTGEVTTFAEHFMRAMLEEDDESLPTYREFIEYFTDSYGGVNEFMTERNYHRSN